MSLPTLSRLRFALCLVLLAVLSLSGSSSAGSSTAGVDVLRSSSYSSGSVLYIVGEVRNNTAGNVRYVRLTATYYDGVGAVLGTTSAYTQHDTLIPGQVSPFKISRASPAGFASYTLAVEYSTTTGSPVPPLPVLSHRTWIATPGALWVAGELQNSTASNVKSIKIIITLYNAAGTVINVDYAYSTIDILLPGQKAPFRTSISSGPTDYATLTITTDARFTTDVPPNLRTISLNSHTDHLGWLHFAGQVQNLGAVPVAYEDVVVTLYDASGTFVNCATDPTDPSTIPAGGTAEFEVLFYSQHAGWTTYAIYPSEAAAQPTVTPTATHTGVATLSPTVQPSPTPTGELTPSAALHVYLPVVVRR
jgi:hypothetical protein